MASLGGSAVNNPPAKLETWVLSLGWEDPLEKEMATNSIFLAWEIPWTEEPSRLQSMGSQRIRQDWATKDRTNTMLTLVPKRSQFSVIQLFHYYYSTNIIGFPGGSVVKNPPANAGDSEDGGSIPGLGRSPGEGNGKLLQYYCLGNPMDKGSWRATVHGVTKSRTWLSN